MGYALIGGAAYMVLKGKMESPPFVPGSVGTDPWTRFDHLYMRYQTPQISWKFLKAIAIVESDNGQNASVARGLASPRDIAGSASSDKKSWGLMQIAPGVGSAEEIRLKEGASPESLNNPENSVRIAAKLLNYLYTQFGALGPEFIAKAYNQGEKNTYSEIATGKGYTGNYYEKFKKAFNKVEGK